MNWFSQLTPPGIKKMFSKRDIPDNLWIKCPISGEMIFHKDLEQAQFVTPAGYHMRIGPKYRFDYSFDGQYEEIEFPDVLTDPLKFKDEKRYVDRLKSSRQKTGYKDAMCAAIGYLESIKTTILVQNFAFMGGSLGLAAGEAFVKTCERACQEKTPLIIYTSSGGARMQEGTFSLMQLPRTIIAIQKLRQKRLPYLVVLTDPTTGGVSASYAMLGDVHIAEPGALIGFAGPRVIEQTIREKLPGGFQRAEYLKKKGMVDMVVHRQHLKTVLGRLLRILTKKMPIADGKIALDSSMSDQTKSAEKK